MVKKIDCGIQTFYRFAHYTHMHMQMREVQQKVESLRRQMNMFVPLADTMPDFVLESQGK